MSKQQFCFLFLTLVTTDVRICFTNNSQIGRFKGQINWYTIQSKDTDSATLDPGYHKFDIRTEKIVLIANDTDFIDGKSCFSFKFIIDVIYVSEKKTTLLG